MEATSKRLYLLDAFALIYRAYFALAKNPIKNSKGLNTSAIYGFTQTMVDLLQSQHPTHMAVVFDAMEVTDRALEHDFYKAHRAPMPEDIALSIPYIKAVVDAFDIPRMELPGYEADDVMGSLAVLAEKAGFEVLMVTPDKDFGQLVTEQIKIYKPAYMGKPAEILGVSDILGRWQIERVSQVIDMLGLMGDASDNIPGIPGVGEKTAQKLISEYGDVEGVLAHADRIEGKLGEKIREHNEMAGISKKLATIITTAPVALEEDRLRVSEPHREELQALFAELEFRSLGKRVLGDGYTVNTPKAPPRDLFSDLPAESAPAPASANVAGATRGKTIENTAHRYEAIAQFEALKPLLEQLLAQTEVCFDTETTHLNAQEAFPIGVSFCWKAHEAVFVRLPDDEYEAKQWLHALDPFWQHPSIVKIGQNIKYDLLVLRWAGIEVKGPLYDTMLAHFLLDQESRHNMNALSENYLGYSPISIEQLIGPKGKGQLNMRSVALPLLTDYAAEDADVTFQLKQTFAPQVEQEGFQRLLEEVELPLVEVLCAMEHEGVQVDTDFLREYSEVLEREAAHCQEQIYALSGKVFNIDSPKQLGEVLFDHLKIPFDGKKTKTGQYATGEEVLEKLSHDHPVVAFVQEYREINKLKSTYVDALPLLIHRKTGRIHTHFNQAVAATGRLSSTQPNLQNIPIRTERGRKIRRAFTSRGEGFVLLSADYSQIELRLVAEISRDEGMLAAFQRGEDIHASTAARVFGIPLEEVSREQRANAKMVNFGIIYGISAFGLSQRGGMSRKEAAAIIEEYFRQYPGIKRYMEESVAYAREHGYVKTMMGRKRHLPDIHSKNQAVRGFAERNAINTPIQGSAADMIKIAMIRIYKAMQERNLQSKMTLQVHDELLFDVFEPEKEEIERLVRSHMQDAFTLTVPVVVDTGWGKNWLEAH